MTTRRDILKALAAIPFIGWVNKAFAATPKNVYEGASSIMRCGPRYARLEVSIKRGLIQATDQIAVKNNVRCWLDGIEIIHRVSAANDIEGWADLFDVTASGTRAFPEVIHRHYGAVRFEVTPWPRIPVL